MTSHLGFNLCTFILVVLVSIRLCAEELPRKIPVPDGAAQAEALKDIKEVYGTEWNAAKTPALKQTLAKKLLQKGRETVGDKSAQFVLFRLAKDTAIQAPDFATAFEAIDATDSLYQVDALDLKAEALSKIAPLTTAPDHHKILSQKSSELSDLAVVKGNYALAKQFAELAVSEARRGNDTAFTKQAAEHKSKVDERAKAFDAAKAALDTLSKSPNDPEANLIVGKYYCFVEGNWKTGLPMLVLSGDPALKPLAETEVKGVASSDDQAKLGNRWWEAGQKERAVYWYRQALPGLSGLAKDKAEKRVAETTVVPGAEKKWNDLLSKVDITKDAVAGRWSRNGNSIGSDESNRPRIMFPMAIDGSYELSVEFSRDTGDNLVAIAFPVKDHSVCLILSIITPDPSHQSLGGLDAIDGKGVWDQGNPTTFRLSLKNGQKYRALIKVQLKDDAATIEAILDRQTIVRWNGPVSSLKPNVGWGMPDSKKPGLGNFGVVTIYSVNWRQLP